MNNLRDKAYNQQKLSVFGKYGVYLSKKIIENTLIKYNKIKEINILDLGSGYYASHIQNLKKFVKEATVVDVEISQEVKKLPYVKVYEQDIKKCFENFKDNYFDVVLFNSVMEHIDYPLDVLINIKKTLKEDGILLINVPTWSGKYFLELLAFKLKLDNSKYEIDDHKMYYDKKSLWVLLVKSGFKPSNIKMQYKKFGLNLFCICKK